MTATRTRLGRRLAQSSHQERTILAIAAVSAAVPFLLGFQDGFDVIGWLSGVAVGCGLTLLLFLVERRPAPSIQERSAPGQSVSLLLFMGDDWENAVEYGKFRLQGHPRVGGKIGRRTLDGKELFAWRVVSIRDDHAPVNDAKTGDIAKVLVREGLARPTPQSDSWRHDTGVPTPQSGRCHTGNRR